MRKITIFGFALAIGLLAVSGTRLHTQEGRGPDRGPGRPQNPLMIALDADQDGEISVEEMRNSPAALKKLDKNGDGKLSREELRPEGDDRDERGDRRGSEDERGRGGPDRGGRPQQPQPGATKKGPGDQARPTRTAAKSEIPGFVLLPGGKFEMGDHHDLGGREHPSDEIPTHTVRVDSFHMATTETTNEQYCEYLDSALSKHLIEVKNGFVYGAGGRDLYCDTRESDQASGIQWNGGKFAVLPNREKHPVVCIRWHGAAAYCNWLSSQKKLQPCYNVSTWECDYSKKGFRLPTEAEWEYAGRGGCYGPYYIFPWGDEPDNSKANWPNSGDPYETGPYPWTTPVGFYNGQSHRKGDFGWPGSQESYQTSDGANGYGLYDMSGNVWEWVNDWYDHDYYRSSPSENPHGPDKGQPMRDGKPYRVLRSGSWYNGQWGHGRVSNRNPSYYRGPDDPNHRWYHIGFRVVLAR